jgi:hypothetical protein
MEFDDKDVELAVLRRKVEQLSSERGIPENYLTVE